MSTASDEAFLVGAIRRALGQIATTRENDAAIVQAVTDASEALESLEQILGLREKDRECSCCGAPLTPQGKCSELNDTGCTSTDDGPIGATDTDDS